MVLSRKRESSYDLSHKEVSDSNNQNSNDDGDINPINSKLTAIERCDYARKLWLSATAFEDLDSVEALYKAALNAKSAKRPRSETKIQNSKFRKKEAQYAELSPTDYRKAAEYLSLLYCQSGRTLKAKPGLAYLGFECRLARQVLDYPMERRGQKQLKTIHRPKKNKKQSHNQNNKGSLNASPCAIFDDFLHPNELKHLQTIFESPSANYWTHHNYRVDPPSPYFSYVIDLHSNDADAHGNNGFMAQLARKIQQVPQIRAKFPKLREATRVEIWAHNRPHASGHQLHFDSDDEGRNGVRNPICSTILYLSENTAGGPSLVTNQRLSSNHLATKGWLAHPKARRLVIFDGSVLHGVIPGKGVQEGRRVTVMMAFWKHIKIRNENTAGSARPFPSPKKTEKSMSWASQMTKFLAETKVQDSRPTSLQETAPINLSCVYETLDGDPWKKEMDMPDYERVFQGF